MSLVSIAIDIPDLGDIVPTQNEIERALKSVGGEYLRLQTKRINNGLDASGQPFKPYHPMYAANKSLAGRGGKNEWLRLTGKMLRSQTVRVKRVGKGVEMTIGFTGSRADDVFRNSLAVKRDAAVRRASRSKRAMAASEFDRRVQKQIEDAGRSKRGALMAKNARMSVVPGKRRIANSLLAEYNDKTRPFVGVPPSEVARLQEVFVNAIRRTGPMPAASGAAAKMG